MPHTRSPPPRSTALRQSSPRTPAPHRAAPAVGPATPTPAPPPAAPAPPRAIHPGRLPIQHLRREVLRRPVEFTQYLSIRYTERLAAAGVEPSVGAELLDGHHRHLGCRVGAFAELEEAAPLADGAILRLVAS